MAENLRRNPLDPDIVGPTVLYPVAPEQLAGVSLTVRLRGSAASRMNEGFARKAHQILAAVDPALRMGEVQARAQADSEDALAVRLVALALSCILVTVLLFSAAGVYSLMSFTVSQRRREIGIRAALGASSMDVLRSVFSRVAVQVGMGVALGALGAMAIAPAQRRRGVGRATGDGHACHCADHGAWWVWSPRTDRRDAACGFSRRKR